jgi:hypothetical protein
MSLPAFEYTNSSSVVVTINLTVPLKSDNPYELRANRKDSQSKSGQKQSSYDFDEETKIIELTFLTGAEKDAIRLMFSDTASQGSTFSFIPDQDVPGTFDTVTIVDRKINFVREAPGLDNWATKFTIRKEVS